MPDEEPIDDASGVRKGDDPAAAGALFGVLYNELHAVAERELRRGGGELTLGTTTLLHEAYLRLAERDGAQFANRAHFLAYAASAMRRLTIDYARRRQAQKRGGEFHLVPLPDENAEGSATPGVASTEAASADSLEALGGALEELAAVDPSLAELVDLHFFCGLSLVEIAALRNVSERTVGRDWRRARLLLHRTLEAP